MRIEHRVATLISSVEATLWHSLLNKVKTPKELYKMGHNANALLNQIGHPRPLFHFTFVLFAQFETIKM